MINNFISKSFALLSATLLLWEGGCTNAPLKTLPKGPSSTKSSSSSTPSRSPLSRPRPSGSSSSPSSFTSSTEPGAGQTTSPDVIPVNYTPSNSQRAFLAASKAEIQTKTGEFTEGCLAYQQNPSPQSPTPSWSYYPGCYPGQSKEAAVESTTKYCEDVLVVQYCARAKGTYQKYCLQELKTVCKMW